MATQAQSKYIADLAVLKTKEFKEVKELVVAAGIVKADNGIVANAGTLAEICHALTDFQASRLIDALTAAKAPERGQAYSANRIKSTVAGLDDIKAAVDDWSFPA